jgi:hypothetical protein
MSRVLVSWVAVAATTLVGVIAVTDHRGQLTLYGAAMLVTAAAGWLAYLELGAVERISAQVRQLEASAEVIAVVRDIERARRRR